MAGVLRVFSIAMYSHRCINDNFEGWLNASTKSWDLDWSPFESHHLRKNPHIHLLFSCSFTNAVPPFVKYLHGAHDHHDCDLNPHGITCPVAMAAHTSLHALNYMLQSKWKDTPATFISPTTWVGRSELYVRGKRPVGQLGILRESAFTWARLLCTSKVVSSTCPREVRAALWAHTHSIFDKRYGRRREQRIPERYW